MFKGRKSERDRDGNLESTVVRSNTGGWGIYHREIYGGGDTLICDKSRYQGDNLDFGRNHGGHRLWAEPVVSSLVVLAVGADASGALASGATAEVIPWPARGGAVKVVKKMAKDCILATLGRKRLLLGAGLAGQTDWSGTNSLFSTERRSKSTRELDQTATLKF